MNYWLVKTEPDTFGYDDMVKDGKAIWDGVRNYAARIFLSQMKIGDIVLIYHSVSEKAIVGIAKVTREAFQDPTTEDTKWIAVEMVPDGKVPFPVTLQKIKEDEFFANFALVKQSRLSVMPVEKKQYEVLMGMANKKKNE